MIFSINVLIFVERVLKNILRLSRINYLYWYFNIYKIYIDERYMRNIFVDAQNNSFE